MNKYILEKIERLQKGEILISREGGNSMEPILKSKEPVILVPMTLEEAVLYLGKGDICFSKIHGVCYTHKVYGVDPEKGVLIGNNSGHLNGWTRNIYAKAFLIPKESQGKGVIENYLQNFIDNWKGYDRL